jgi:proline racemase
MSDLELDVVEYHTGGEPFRMVLPGTVEIQGSTILERRRYIRDHLDHLRRLIINEPRGHADMYGGFITPPEDDGADLGVVFFHNAGYSTACGHGTIALATWAIDSGFIERSGDEMQIVIDCPSGRLPVNVQITDGKVVRARFRNVPSYVVETGLQVETSRGLVTVDVSYGGAFYASVAASSVGLTVEPEDLNEMIFLGREIKHAIEAAVVVEHPDEPELRDIYGVIFFDRLPDRDGALVQRNVAIFADGEVDRSPCGSGTSARLALLNASGELQEGQMLVHRSIVDSEFQAWVVGDSAVGEIPAVITEVQGRAFRVGTHSFVLDSDDELGTGFLLR